MSSCSSLYPVLHGDSRWAMSLLSSLSPPPYLPPSSSFSSSSFLFLLIFLLPLPQGVQHGAWGASQGSAELVHPWSSSESQNPRWQCWNSCTSLCWILPSVSYAWFSYVWMCLHQNHVLLIQARDGKCPWTKLCSGSIFFFLGMQRWTSPRTRTNTWSILLIAWTANCDHFLMVVYEYGV